MGAGSALRDAYASLEDKWYGFVDGISEKVPAFGKFIDGLEDKGIPTFPAFIVLIVIIIAILAYFFVIAANSSLTISVTDGDGNSLEGATVVVLSGSNEVGNLTTGTDGKAIFFLPNGEYSIKIDKETYSTSTKSVTLSGNDSEDMTLTLADAAITKAVYLKTSTGALIDGTGSLIYKCTDSTDEQTAQYANGQFTANVKASCQEIEVISIQNYNLISPRASFAGNSAITVEKQVVLTGSASVTLTVSDTNAAPPAGLRVRLVPNDNTTPIEEISTGTSVVAFDNVPIKSYYVIVADPNGAFDTYDGSQTNGQKEVKQNQLTQFTAVMNRAQASAISVTVKDAATATPVKGAIITLTSNANSNDTQQQITDVSGQKTFHVAAGSTYTISAEQDEYMSGTTKQATAGDTVEVDLVKVGEGMSNSILVKVSDSQGDPIENALVMLKTNDASSPTVGQKTTGASGTAEFFNLDITKTYFATISKEGFGSQSSSSIQAEPRAQKTLEVTFDIGYGTIQVKAMDSDKNPLSGATVKAIDYYTSQQETQTSPVITGSDGIAQFSIRADKKIYFTIESTSYQKYFTASLSSTANASIEKDVIMQTSSGKLNATLVGIFSGTSEVTDSAAASAPVTQGVYTVLAVVSVPKGSYSEAGLQLRTGKETANVTNDVEEDGLYLSSVSSSGRVTEGTTYTPPQGQDIDKKNTTTGNAKWANSVWKNPQQGTYEVEAQITITEENPNVPLNLYYRGWAKGSTTLRDPTGDISGQELYWPAKNRVLTSGSSNLCSASFCKSYILETLSGSDAGKKTYVAGTMTAKKGVSYGLEADLTNFSGKTMSGAVLKVEGKSVDINAVLVNGILQQDFSAVNLGTIGIDAPIKVEVIFTTPSSGNSAINFTINSSKATELDEAVNLSVAVNKKFSLDMVPKVVVPYIDNSLYFSATDGNATLDGVLISIKSGNDLLDTVTTNGEGIARFVLAEPRIGDVLDITAQKEGYDTVEITKKVDNALLTITPMEILQTIKVGDVTSVDTELLLQNDTAKDVKVVSVAVNGNVKSYIDFLFSDTIAGTVIAQGTDRNYGLSLKLNSAAKRIADAKDLDGVLLITTQIAGAGQQFLNEIPITIHLSMPGFLDNAKCLQINPASVDFVASDSEQSKTVTITNNCSAEGINVTLHDIEAKLSEAAKIGTVSLSGTGFANTQLTDKYAKIADSLDNGNDTEVTVRFAPNAAIPSGTQAFSVSLTGLNVLNGDTTEKVSADMKVNATTSLLSKCIEIQQPTGGLLLDMAPWNLGYGALQNSSYSPYLGNYQGVVNRSSPYNMSYTPGLSMSGYGTAGYGANYTGYGTFAGNGIANGVNASYQQNSFIISNNCTNDVDIQLEPDSRITVSEQKFTLSASSDNTVVVQPGYVLGKYNIKVTAKASNTTDTKKDLGNVSVIVRRLGDIDTDCIKTNVTNINLNSFIYKPQQYSVYNYCYDTGVQLVRNNTLATIDCSAPQNEYDLGYFQTNQQSLYGQQYPLTAQNPTYQSYLGQSAAQSTNLQGNGCPRMSCSLITGTQTRNRTVEDGANGSVERVDFDVMPSAKYIPQMKLFNSQNNSYGLFQNLSNIRQWGTETAARTDVYGNLNISYTNQYGSGECMQFPITITDTFRMLESIDSAINWGDPNANPKECQNSNALDIIAFWKDKSPDNGAVPNTEFKQGNGTIYTFVPEPPVLKIGAAPSQQSPYYPGYNTNYYWNQTNSAQLYGQQQPNMQQQNNQPSNGNASKNCGMMDSIDVQTQITPAEAGGARIKIESVGSGSLLNNTRGANLFVEIDRSSMNQNINCVYIDKPITAKVTRAITMQSQNVIWPLRLVFTKPGYTYKGNKEECTQVTDQIKLDCMAALKKELTDRKTAITDPAGISQAITAVTQKMGQCTSLLGTNEAKGLIAEVTTVTGPLQGCTEDFKTYGYDLIKNAGFKSFKPDDMVDCSVFFCNNDMLQAKVLTNFLEIKDKIAKSGYNGNPMKVDPKNTMLSKLYMQAPVTQLKICNGADYNFYGKEGGALSFGSFAFTKDILGIGSNPDYNAAINKIESESAITDMFTVLNTKIPQKDFNSLLVEIDPNTKDPNFDDQIKALGALKAGEEYYLPLENYKQILKSAKDKLTIFNVANASIDFSAVGQPCGITKVVSADTFRWMSWHSRIVIGITQKDKQSQQEIEQIYVANPKLNEIHRLAKFSTATAALKDKSGAAIDDKINNNLLLTNIPDTTIGLKVEWLADAPPNIKDLSLEFKDTKGNAKPSITVGSYPAEIDFDYTTDAKKATFVIGDINAIGSAPKAGMNPLLEAGFPDSTKVAVTPEHILDNVTSGTILSYANALSFYQRIPLKLSVELFANEPAFSYKVDTSQSIMPQSLIKWYSDSGEPLINGGESRTANGYTVGVQPKQVTQTMKGIYYYSKGNRLMIMPRTVIGGSVLASIDTKYLTRVYPIIQIPSKGQAAVPIEVGADVTPELMTFDTIIQEITSGNACPTNNGAFWNEKKIISGS